MKYVLHHHAFDKWVLHSSQSLIYFVQKFGWVLISDGSYFLAGPLTSSDVWNGSLTKRNAKTGGPVADSNAYGPIERDRRLHE